METTIARSDQFKVWRTATADPRGPKSWRELRRSVADMERRAEVCRAANGRYLEALAATTDRVPLCQRASTVCAPVRRRGRRHRALNPLQARDAALLQAVNRGEFALHGFRNAQLRAQLYPAVAMSKKVARALAARVRRQIVLLRAHGLVKKVGRTRRYLVTAKGRHVITALLAARQADVAQLTQLAA